jgi:hypothetical protein
MNDVGYLYVLANSAMPGLIKVGKTTRSPSERAFELSSATGLPTPFIVVYEQLFSDCSSAESFVHTYLQTKGFRVADNREFFSAPVNDVVRAIALAPGAISSDSEYVMHEIEDQFTVLLEPDELDALQVESLSLNVQTPWGATFNDAEDAYFGHGDSLQDYKEALRLYVHSAKLGAIHAYARIGQMNEAGEGTQSSKTIALKYYKEGARKGSIYCYWAMAMLFWSKFDPQNRHLDNANKCFSLFLEKTQNTLLHDDGLTRVEVSQIIRDCGSLLFIWLTYEVEYPSIIENFIKEIRQEISEHVREMAEVCSRNNNNEMRFQYQNVDTYLRSID